MSNNLSRFDSKDFSDFSKARTKKRGRCSVCKKRFTGFRVQKYCSDACRQKAFRERRKTEREQRQTNRGIHFNDDQS
jgi:hypothetical protein